MSHVLLQFPYKPMHKYPGMRPKDVAVWERFMTANPDAFVEVYYDAHVGDPVSAPELHDEMRASGAFDVCQWCVDVIARAPNITYVIEVKPNAGAGALGQALAYTKLLQREGRIPVNSVPVVLTDNISPILQEAARLLGVLIFTA